MSPPYPIIIVTGANGGVGFGICQRLLQNFCATNSAPDALPQPLATPGDAIKCDFVPATRLSLVLACRSMKKASAAKQGLEEYLDKLMLKAKEREDQKLVGHMKEFRKNLEIDLLPLDLGSVKSTFQFCDAVSKRYPYISHAIFNAGCAPWSGRDSMIMMRQLLFAFTESVTRPRYKLQTPGVVSDDGLGWTFQCNLFGHFIVARELEPLLRRSPWTPRVIWTTSLDLAPALPMDWEDWQILKTRYVYEASKYQIALVSTVLDIQENERNPSTKGHSIRHLISHPSVTATNIFTSHLSFVTEFLMVVVFYVARWLGSTSHPITWFKGAIAAVHLALVPSVLLAAPEAAALYGSRATFSGKEFVERDPLIEWPEHKKQAQALLARCDNLYTKVKSERTESLTSEKSS